MDPQPHQMLAACVPEQNNMFCSVCLSTMQRINQRLSSGTDQKKKDEDFFYGIPTALGSVFHLIGIQILPSSASLTCVSGSLRRHTLALT